MAVAIIKKSKYFLLQVKTNKPPVLRSRSRFPKVQYLEAGQGIDLVCDVEYTDPDDTTFYIRGEKVQRSMSKCSFCKTII